MLPNKGQDVRRKSECSENSGYTLGSGEMDPNLIPGETTSYGVSNQALNSASHPSSYPSSNQASHPSSHPSSTQASNLTSNLTSNLSSNPQHQTSLIIDINKLPTLPQIQNRIQPPNTPTQIFSPTPSSNTSFNDTHPPASTTLISPTLISTTQQNNKTSTSSTNETVSTPELPAPPRVKKHKKGPAPKLNGDERCMVCNEKASGFHYGVLSCEGCKGFFRRSENREKINYKCKTNKSCDLKDDNPLIKRKCQYCRYWKCVELGMKNHIQQSAVINELRRQMQAAPDIEQTQFVIKQEQIESLGDKTTNSHSVTLNTLRHGVGVGYHQDQTSNFQNLSNPSNLSNLSNLPSLSNIAGDLHPQLNSFTTQLPNFHKRHFSDSDNSRSNPSRSPMSTNSTSHSPVSHIISKFTIPRVPVKRKALDPRDIHKLSFAIPPRFLLSHVKASPEDNAEIDKFADMFMKSLYPEEIDLAHCTSWSSGTSAADQQTRAKHFADLALISAQIFINQCNLIPAFTTLPIPDQICLTKQGLLEVFYLRLALQYNTSDDTIIFINGGRYSKSCFIEVGHSKSYVDSMYKWCRELYCLLVDFQVSSLVFVIIVFNGNRESLTNAGKLIVEKTQDKYLNYLQMHCKKIYSDDKPFLFHHLLTKLRTMTDLLNMNSAQVQDSGNVEIMNRLRPFHGNDVTDARNDDVKSSDFLHLTSPCSYNNQKQQEYKE